MPATSLKSLVVLPALQAEFSKLAETLRQENGTVLWRRHDRTELSLLTSGDGLYTAPGEELPEEVECAVVPSETCLDLGVLAGHVEALVKAGKTVLVEVISLESAERALQAGASGLIIAGLEAGGVVSEDSGLVLLRRIRSRTKAPLYVRGAIGPDSAAACVAAGAEGVVFEEELYLAEDYRTSEPIRERLKTFNPTDTRCLGMTLGFRYRAFGMIATRSVRNLAKEEVAFLEAGRSGEEFLLRIQSEEGRRWDLDLKDQIWPIGQGAGLAAPLAERFGEAAQIVAGISSSVEATLAGLLDDFPLQEGKGIAELNGTRLPIHQGPMAQVSDCPRFARAVFDEGALPWLALGNMPASVAEEIVAATTMAMEGRPFGAGIIGLDANRHRDAHMEMMKRRRQETPLLGLVAAGTAEQAMIFESSGITNYLHTPTPGVLRAALQSGQLRVILEGTEAGGHVGELGSMALWQYGVLEIERLLEGGQNPNELAIVLAGGIGDAAGAAAAAAMLFGLHKRGVKVGIQIGSAYLMTREAVTSGAVSATYQDVASEHSRTVIMGETVNTPTRVLWSDAALKVLGREKERLLSGEALGDRKHHYEKDNLGGLRAAAKAERIARVDDAGMAVFERLSVEEQREEGLFHCGQAVALTPAGLSIEELHHAVTTGAKALIRARLERENSLRDEGRMSARVHNQGASARGAKSEILDGDQVVALIGVGVIMPGALTAAEFWENLKAGRSAIKEVPKDRWDPALFWDSNRETSDKTYSKIGGFVEGFDFDRRSFRLPPRVLASIDPTQLVCLQAVKEAMEDSGYDQRDFDRDRCAVILGNALGGDLRDETTLRIMYPKVDQAIRGALMELSQGRLHGGEREELLELVEARFKEHLVGINEDSMAGELANVIAGRVAQCFDLRGPNFVTDAACASSLAALESAVRGLQSRHFDMVVTGGADRSMGVPSYVKFSKIGALSPDGSRPFDANANGFVMGEGAGIVILKRLSDALRDGDKVYALIRGIGGSSDGRGKGITAPNPEGQKLALRRAYQDGGINPGSVGLFEAHGTSTPVGDPVEVASILGVLSEDNSANQSPRIGLGSVKSNIGHLKSAAGAAGIIKVAMALRDKVLPKTLNVEQVNPALGLDGSTLDVQLQTEDWRSLAGVPRRAGVSAFGFGGTNFHVVMEEYLPEAQNKKTFYPAAERIQNEGASKSALRCDGVFALSTSQESGLLDELTKALQGLEERGLEAVEERILSLEEPLSTPEEGHRIAIAFGDIEELKSRMEKAIKALGGKGSWRILGNQGIYYTERPTSGKVGMLFPGQGTQYLGMLSDLKDRFPVVAETFEEADRIMAPIIDARLSAIIDPDLSQVDELTAFKELTRTEITQPAVLTADVALYRLLQSLGVNADMVAGHSLGEYGACVAAGVLSFEDALKTVAARGTEMARATPMNGDTGLMAGVPAPVEVVQPVLDEIEGYVVCANINCPGQTIIAGLTDSVKRAQRRFEEMGYTVPLLPVSHAFHTEVVAAASGPLRNHLGKMNVNRPEVPILTNVNADFYPEDVDEIRDLLARQVAAPVKFIGLIERMYGEGVRTFVEVGPKKAQTSFVSSILEGRAHLALYTNHPKRGGLQSLFFALAELWAHQPQELAKPQVIETTVEPAATRQVRLEEDVNVPQEPVRAMTVDRNEVVAVMMKVLCEKTGYDAEEIELDFELEADLGVDTVKQAEIMAAVREEYKLERDENFRLAEYPTLDRMADYVMERLEVGSESEKVEDQKTMSLPGRDAEKAAVAQNQVDRSEIVAVMMKVLCEKTGYDAEEIELDFELEADLGVDTVKQAEIMAAVREEYKLERDENFRLAEYPTLDQMADYVMKRLEVGSGPGKVEEQKTMSLPGRDTEKAAVAQNQVDRSEIVAVMMKVLCEKTGYDAEEIELDFELEADLGVDTVKQAEIMAAVREEYSLERDENFRLAEYPTLDRMADYVMERLEVGSGKGNAEEQKTMSLPGRDTEKAAVAQNHARKSEEKEFVAADTVISGCAIGLPGLENIFDEAAAMELLEGRNFIGHVSADVKDRIVKKGIVRLKKHESGGGEMLPVTDPEEVIKLAGQGLNFDLQEWGVSERLIEALDRTSQLAFAAGFEALRDAGLPLIPRYRTTTTGKKITVGWTLPSEVGDRTGVIFASAFAGQDALIEELKASHEEGYQFNHRFLLRILGIANSRFAEYVGARGPNTKINNACASTTTAIGMAQDWIRLGRCDRVIILSADDASGKDLLEWVGSGFLATGAATTEEHVEDAALPFDRRRHGMIIGMGALSLIVERGGLPEERGIEPIADVLATHFANSAFHPTRLDVDHIAGEVEWLFDDAEQRFGIERREIADKTVFISHETYTPARGGSASAEIAALRQAFGDKANEVVIANTKGYTGHAMGAGIEDVLAMKVLQHRRVPPIANFKEPDPELGDLRLSQGGEYEVDYALRLAAGFGSQLALALFRYRARTEDRIFDQLANDNWLQQVSGFKSPRLYVKDRVLRLEEGSGAPRKEPVPIPKPEPTPIPTQEFFPAFPSRPVAVQSMGEVKVDKLDLQKRLRGKRVALVGGPTLLSALLFQNLSALGAEVLSITDVNERGLFDLDHQGCDLLNEDQLEMLFKESGGVHGVVNLLGVTSSQDREEQIYLAARRTFHLGRVFARQVQAAVEETFFLTLTAQGGGMGLGSKDVPRPICGAVAGMTKSFAREWPQWAVKSIDVNPFEMDQEFGFSVLEALFSPGGVEEGLLKGQRMRPVYIDDRPVGTGAAPGTAPLHPIGGEDVVLITGGGRGITAEVAVDLAKRFQCKLALVGRSPLTHPNPREIDFAGAEERARDQITARGERVTPMKVKAALRGLRAQEEIATNQGRMEALGSQVAYFSCDVSKPEAIGALFDQVAATLGPVTGIVHGAGVEESRLLQEKDVAGFDRVFKGKALGGLGLWRTAREKDLTLRFFVAFSSVAGRFGNVGQADYSAANEVLAKVVARMNRETSVQGLCFHWTAWADVGMAVDGSMQTILESRGVEFLSPDEGAPMVGAALAAGERGEYLIAGALGEMAGEDLIRVSSRELGKRVEATRESPLGMGRGSTNPMVHRVLERGPDSLTTERILNPEEDLFLNDHVYEGKAILPGVMGYEMMAYTAELLTGQKVSMGKAIRFEQAIKVHNGEPLLLQAQARRVRNGADKVMVVLSSIRRTRTGRVLETEHFQAEFLYDKPGARQVPAPLVFPEPQRWLQGPLKESIYKRFFHTGTFQVLKEAPFVGSESIVAYGQLPEGPLFRNEDQASPRGVKEPLVREMCFQAIGLWGMIHRKESFLPYGIGRGETFDMPRSGERISIRALRRDDSSQDRISFDVQAYGEAGRLLMAMEKVELIAHRPLLESERFEALPVLSVMSLTIGACEAEEILKTRGLNEAELFSAEELASGERLRSDERRREWRAARVAAREALIRYARDFYGQALPFDAIETRHDENGAPSLAFRGAFTLGVPLPELTLTHSSGQAIAGLSLPGERRRIGLDLERVEARHQGFAKDYFTERERGLAIGVNGSGLTETDALHTGLWAIKEAVSKALGLGLHLSTDEVEVRRFRRCIDSDRVEADVELRGRAQKTLRDLGSERIGVELSFQDGFALATARLS